MREYSNEEIKEFLNTIRKSVRATHKSTALTLDDGRYITSSAMGNPYTLHAEDGSIIGRANTGEQLGELLNERDGGLYRAWTQSSDEARELSLNINWYDRAGRDKLRKLAAQMAEDEDDARPVSDLTPKWHYEFEKLTREARHLLLVWEMQQITPEAAKGLAVLASLDNPPSVQWVPAFGAE